MFAISKTTRAAKRGLMLTALAVVGVVTFGSMAFAGSCPADKMMVDAAKMNSTPAKGVSDKVLAAINLATEATHFDGHMLRLRKLVIQPGGVVPWHSHGDRPAIIYIIQGTIVEHASNCAVPIVHRTGDVTAETHTTAHWWKNTGKQTVILLSADILHDPSDHNM